MIVGAALCGRPRCFAAGDCGGPETNGIKLRQFWNADDTDRTDQHGFICENPSHPYNPCSI
jgi:hypothetical protein